MTPPADDLFASWLPSITTAIDDLARHHPRALKRACRRGVAVAAAAVAALARPGAMLDGCPGLTADAATCLAGRVTDITGVAIVAGELDGCCFLLARAVLGVPPRAPATGGAAGALAGCAPWPILFPEDGPPCWGGVDDAAALAAALAPVVAAVAAAPPGAAVDLASFGVAPPPLNAYLLGYPVAYSVTDQEGATRASRALSEHGVDLTTLCVDVGGDAIPVAAFSVPAALASLPPALGADWWDAWLQSVRRGSGVGVSATRRGEGGTFTL